MNEECVYLIMIDISVNTDRYLEYFAKLPVEQQSQIQNFRFDVDKKLCLLSHLFVRYLACKSLHCLNEELVFAKNDFGKPYLVGIHNFHYNISHTRDAIAVGFSKTQIGIDIEKCQLIDLSIAENYFNRNELSYILSNNEEREKVFYEIWTKKEAYIKWKGIGLAMPLDMFDVTDVKIDNRLSTIEIHDYIISICGQTKYCKKDIVILSERQIAEMLIEFNKY